MAYPAPHSPPSASMRATRSVRNPPSVVSRLRARPRVDIATHRDLSVSPRHIQMTRGAVKPQLAVRYTDLAGSRDGAKRDTRPGCGARSGVVSSSRRELRALALPVPSRCGSQKRDGPPYVGPLEIQLAICRPASITGRIGPARTLPAIRRRSFGEGRPQSHSRRPRRAS